MPPTTERLALTVNAPRLVRDRIKNFVGANSSTGEVIARELIQNADDAGATYLHITLDERRGIQSRPLASLTSPSLLVVNDAPFKADQERDDFRAIRTMTDGHKEQDVVAAGRFGVGFLSVFLAAENVLILSSRRFLLFDFNNHFTPKPGGDREEQLQQWVSAFSVIGSSYAS